MKERPIIFKADDVLSILGVRKTQVRIALSSDFDVSEMATLEQWSSALASNSCFGRNITDDEIKRKAEQLKGILHPVVTSGGIMVGLRCPYGKPGDHLWVRETTEVDEETSDILCLSRYSADKAPVLYSGDPTDPYTGSIAHWNYPRAVRPSIHMPRWASRIQLEITDVRVERLSDISEDDALSEGCAGGIGHFRYVWGGIYGEGSWRSNPWVWVIEFKRV